MTKSKKKIVFDLGFFNGQDSINYINKGYKVIAVEANSFLCKKYKKKYLKHIKSKDLIIINRIFSKNPNAIFYYNPHEIFRGSVDKNLATNTKFSPEMYDLKFKKKVIAVKLPLTNLLKFLLIHKNFDQSYLYDIKNVIWLSLKNKISCFLCSHGKIKVVGV